jgi:hypothetical protein
MKLGLNHPGQCFDGDDESPGVNICQLVDCVQAETQRALSGAILSGARVIIDKHLRPLHTAKMTKH